ncbi:ATP-binding protein [Methylobacterium brachiatum]|uniref:ATP-binding protein n=1 Tax=Methylobacterium brachiatum TaxID=269660 RepID=UPI0013CE3FE3|nr:ATP-binding protein [Methylobacterium brachiatum]
MSGFVEPFNIQINAIDDKGYKSIKNITWNNIPGFAILTGKNGSGKTQLLEVLSYFFSKSFLPGVGMPVRVQTSGGSYSAGDVAYIPSVGRFSDGPAISLTSMAQQRQNLVNLAMMSVNGQQFYEPNQAAASRKALELFKGRNPQSMTPEQVDELLRAPNRTGTDRVGRRWS